jgi:hypothetical protein
VRVATEQKQGSPSRVRALARADDVRTGAGNHDGKKYSTEAAAVEGNDRRGGCQAGAFAITPGRS